MEMDKIIVEQARFSLYLGVTEEERTQLQEVVVDLTLFCDTQRSAHTDNLKDTIDYYPLYQRIKKLLIEREYRLIETVAESIAKDLLQCQGVQKVSVCVKKPQALPYAAYAAVYIVRKK